MVFVVVEGSVSVFMAVDMEFELWGRWELWLGRRSDEGKKGMN